MEAAAHLRDGAVVVAAITSCTNTSNPSVLVAAGLVARRAVELGLGVAPWVKTSLAPGSRVVMDYLDRAGLRRAARRRWASTSPGYGCTTCIGNSGPLLEGVSDAVNEHDLSVVSVLSGNRNFEGRIHPDVKQNFLASPPLVVAYALAGTIDIDLTTEPLGTGANGEPVFLKDLWPTDAEVADAVRASITPDMFETRYARGVRRRRALGGDPGDVGESPTPGTTARPTSSSPVLRGPDDGAGPVEDVAGARVLAKLGDSVTTDHISPAGSHPPQRPRRPLPDRRRRRAPGLQQLRHAPRQPRGHGARHVRQRAPAQPAGPGHRGRRHAQAARGHPDVDLRRGDGLRRRGTPLIMLGGKEYGSGSSRDWAAKGTKLLGVRAVLVESFERIHRSNLVGMGVLPLQFMPGESARTYGLDGTETYDDRAGSTRSTAARPSRTCTSPPPTPTARSSASACACASTRPPRPSTTATAACSTTCCASWPASRTAPSRFAAASTESKKWTWRSALLAKWRSRPDRLVGAGHRHAHAVVVEVGHHLGQGRQPGVVAVGDRHGVEDDVLGVGVLLQDWWTSRRKAPALAKKRVVEEHRQDVVHLLQQYATEPGTT